MPLDQDMLDAVWPALANPFEDPRRDQAVRTGAADLERLRAGADALAAAGRIKEARRLLLVIGMVEASRGEPVYGECSVPDATFEAAGFNKSQLRNVVAAAARCEKRLADVAGISGSAIQLRAQVWRACFASSLDDALRLQHVIRQQNVLILGETGTGKELVADALQLGAIGAWNDDRIAPRQTINAAAIPSELLETELFGHIRGAFTGAFKDREGKIASADGGTFFFDEVGDLPVSFQPKLLRVIESNRVTPIGSNRDVEVDVRYISATSFPLDELVGRSAFRRDLYERLTGIVIRIPPLRDRREDIKPIARAILERLKEDQRQRRFRAEPSASVFVRLAVDLGAWDLESYEWPGNVRELENFVRMQVLGFAGPPPRRATPVGLPLPPVGASAPAAGDTTPEGDSGEIITPTPSDPRDWIPERVLTREASLDEVKEWYVRAVLDANDGNQAVASRQLRIDRGTLARYVRRDGGAPPPRNG
jgi:transcriptional regulator with GAF, ATPase, and Fis domain